MWHTRLKAYRLPYLQQIFFINLGGYNDMSRPTNNAKQKESQMQVCNYLLAIILKKDSVDGTLLVQLQRTT